LAQNPGIVVDPPTGIESPQLGGVKTNTVFDPAQADEAAFHGATEVRADENEATTVHALTI